MVVESTLAAGNRADGGPANPQARSNLALRKLALIKQTANLTD
ncbi:MAG TPA: hypothetical protein VGK58_14005 [Lacipirellulaceae bacterium]